jgi:hypothetical protein
MPECCNKIGKTRGNSEKTTEEENTEGGQKLEVCQRE